MTISPYLNQLRTKVGSTLLQMITIRLVIRDSDGRILMVRHQDSKHWAMPGGAMEPHETPAEAAVRTALEETGLVVEPMQMLGVYAGPEYHLTYTNGDEISVTAIVFDCSVKDEQVRGNQAKDPQDTIELKYFSAQELQRLDSPPWLRLELDDILKQPQSTRFQPSTWSPPEDGIQHGGISAHMGKLREIVGTDMLMTPTACGVVFDSQGRVLLQKRSDNGEWSVPGGATDPHECPADATAREVWEETGVLVEPVRIAGVYGGSEFFGVYPHGDQFSVLSIVFGCRVIDGTIRLENDESLDARFFDVDDIPWNKLSARWVRRLRNSLDARDFAYFDGPADSVI